ncbi:AraC family transcriptional regulator [Odoribacter sp. OttesenSCG-928-J03]|nr:AraC family transcriptional regulator [Odoribacter sp. OttesenSCG-928-J03]
MNDTLQESGKLIRLQDNTFINVFRLEDVDDVLFNNYQRYDFFQLIWFTEVVGEVAYFLDFDEYILEKDNMVLVFPGQIDKMDVDGKKGYLFTIENNLFFDINNRLGSDLLNGYYGNVFLKVNEETGKQLKTLTNLLSDEIDREKRFPLLRSYMESILFHFSALFDATGEAGEKTDTRVGKLMRLIDRHFMTHRETDFYAGELNLTHKQLNIITQKGTGKTVKQHLQERLILEMKKEIRLGAKNLKEIAFDLGFSEPAYFARFFKQHTSQTPTEFRDQQ